MKETLQTTCANDEITVITGIPVDGARDRRKYGDVCRVSESSRGVIITWMTHVFVYCAGEKSSGDKTQQ